MNYGQTYGTSAPSAGYGVTFGPAYVAWYAETLYNDVAATPAASRAAYAASLRTELNAGLVAGSIPAADYAAYIAAVDAGESGQIMALPGEMNPYAAPAPRVNWEEDREEWGHKLNEFRAVLASGDLSALGPGIKTLAEARALLAASTVWPDNFRAAMLAAIDEQMDAQASAAQSEALRKLTIPLLAVLAGAGYWYYNKSK